MPNNTSGNLKKEVATAPQKPGVYRWKDKNEDVLYVGKAKNLRNRLKSYVQKKPDKTMGPWKLALIERIAGVEWTVTNSELEALVLETNLIKELKPKYNVMMKDDKNYVYVEISKEPFARVDIVRRMLNKQAIYFGPYTKKFQIEKVLETLQSVFNYRSDGETLKRLNRAAAKNNLTEEMQKMRRETPPLEHQIGKCNDLCLGQMEQVEYNRRVTQVMRFLRGDQSETVKQLAEMMKQAAMERKFEKAARLRDALQFIGQISEKQIISDTSGENADILGVAIYGRQAQIILLQERNGKLINELGFSLKGEGENVPAILQQFIAQYYSEAGQDIPSLIIVGQEINDKHLLEKWLTDIGGKKTEIRLPERGKKLDLLRLARNNAEERMKQAEVKWAAAARNLEEALEELKNTLKLPGLPKRIEGYDISHLGGSETVGSMVVMKNGQPANDQYRSFAVRSLKEGEIDDYKALTETLLRRLKYLVNQERKWQAENVVFSKAKKSEENTLKEIVKKNSLDGFEFDYKQFFVARHENKIIACGRVRPHKNNFMEFSTGWVDKKYRGRGLGRYLISLILKKLKKGRVYLATKPENAGYYQSAGFRHLHTPPKPLTDKMEKEWKKIRPRSEVLVCDLKDISPDTSLAAQPDLLVIDGGKGQLSTVSAVLKDQNLDIPVIGLAKREEEVFVPEKNDPVFFKPDSPAKFLLIRLRNEAHRFANKLREAKGNKKMTASTLDEISGIGPETKKKLLGKFQSVKNIKTTPDEELKEVVSDSQLKMIREHLQYPR